MFSNLESIVFLVVTVYIWLVFGFLSDKVSCDMKIIMNNIYYKQIAAIISIFLLFVVIENDSNKNLFTVLKDTLFIYIIYLLLTKNKWYFIVPIIIIAVIDQMIKVEINYRQNILDKLNNKNDNNNDNNKEEILKHNNFVNDFSNYRNNIQKILLILIIISFIHYLIKQKIEFKDKFDLSKFLFTHTCKNNKF